MLPQDGEVDWAELIDCHGKPLESSILNDAQWKAAVAENRVVTIHYSRSGKPYTGQVGIHSGLVMCRAVFATPLPPTMTYRNANLDDIDWDFAEVTNRSQRATVELLAAVRSGDLDTIKDALTQDADPNHRPLGGKTPLCSAISAGHYNVAVFLLENGANVKNDYGPDFWRTAMIAGHDSFAQLLVQKGIQPPPFAETLLQAAFEGNVDVAMKMISAGASATGEASFFDGSIGGYSLWMTPLNAASVAGQRSIVELMLKSGADVNSRDKSGFSPWMQAVAGGHAELGQFLERSGAATDIQGALIRAVQIGSIATIERLIALGADLNAKWMGGEKDSSLPLLAAFHARGELGLLNCRSTSLDWESENILRSQLIEVLLRSGAAPEIVATVTEGRPLLLLAAEKEDEHVLAALVRHGVDVNQRDATTGETSLAIVCQKLSINQSKKLACAKHLLMAGADPNLSDLEGRPPLIRIFKDKDGMVPIELVHWLVAFGADPNAIATNGKTVRDYANRQAKRNPDDPKLTEIIGLLDNSDALDEYAGLYGELPASSQDWFRRVNCSLSWFDNREMAIDAAASTAQMDLEGAALVTQALTNADSRMRFVAVKAITSVTPDCTHVIPLLIYRLYDEDADVADAARTSLVSMGSPTLPLLTQALCTAGVEVQLRAAEAMCRIDIQHASLARESLKQHLQPEDDAGSDGSATSVAAKIHAVLGCIAALSEDWEDAAREYAASVSMNPSLGLGSGPWHALAAARLHLKDGSLKSAIEAYNAGQRDEHKHNMGWGSRAIECYLKAIEADPTFPWGLNALAWLLATCNDEPSIRNGAQAIKYAKTACEVTDWQDNGILLTLAAAYAEDGQFAEAAELVENVIHDSSIDLERFILVSSILRRSLPQDEAATSGSVALTAGKIHCVLGHVAALAQDWDDAIHEYTASVSLNPSLETGLWRSLATLRLRGGDGALDAAIDAYHAGRELAENGDYKNAIDSYREAMRIDRTFPWGFNNLAWLLATCGDESVRDGLQAIECAKVACELTKWRDHGTLDTLAAAYAEGGRFAEAVEIEEKAIRYSTAESREDYVHALSCYQKGLRWSANIVGDGNKNEESVSEPDDSD